MPSSLSCGEVREKRASHEGNLLAYLLRPRPIRVRKVGTSGTKGRGWGIGGAGLVLCSCRICPVREKALPLCRSRPKVDRSRSPFILLEMDVSR